MQVCVLNVMCPHFMNASSFFYKHVSFVLCLLLVPVDWRVMFSLVCTTPLMMPPQPAAVHIKPSLAGRQSSTMLPKPSPWPVTPTAAASSGKETLLNLRLHTSATARSRASSQYIFFIKLAGLRVQHTLSGIEVEAWSLSLISSVILVRRDPFFQAGAATAVRSWTIVRLARACPVPISGLHVLPLRRTSCLHPSITNTARAACQTWCPTTHTLMLTPTLSLAHRTTLLHITYLAMPLLTMNPTLLPTLMVLMYTRMNLKDTTMSIPHTMRMGTMETGAAKITGWCTIPMQH